LLLLLLLLLPPPPPPLLLLPLLLLLRAASLHSSHVTACSCGLCCLLFLACLRPVVPSGKNASQSSRWAPMHAAPPVDL
jgi:hypothetical protein